jgi:hypothetical protein
MPLVDAKIGVTGLVQPLDVLDRVFPLKWRGQYVLEGRHLIEPDGPIRRWYTVSNWRASIWQRACDRHKPVEARWIETPDGNELIDVAEVDETKETQ